MYDANEPLRQPFRVRLFRGFVSQRRALVEADALREERFHEELEEQIVALGEGRVVPNREPLFLDLVVSVRRLLRASVLLNVLITVAMFGSVLASREILDSEAPVHVALLLCAGFLVAEVCGHGVAWYEARVRAQIGRTVAVRILGLLSRKLVTLSPAERARFSSGKLKTMVAADSETVGEFFEHFAWEGIPSVVILVLALPVVWMTAGYAGLAAIAVACLQIPASILLGRFLTRYSTALRSHEDRLSTVVGEWIRNVRLVRFLGWQGVFLRDVASLYRGLAKVGAKEHALFILAYGISFCWWMTPMLSAVFVATLSGTPIGLADLFASFWVVNHLSNHLRYIPQAIALFAKAHASLARLGEFLRAPDLSSRFVPPRVALSASARPVAVRLENVTVRFGKKVALDRVSLRFTLRERAAIIGPVGSGKTCILKLISGDLFPSEGRVVVELSDGSEHDLWEEQTYQRLRANLAVVPQEAFLSNTSLRANITLDKETDDAWVNDVVGRAQLQADMELLSGGLDEEIGESGINLSGGQKQRVSIARALCSRRPWLLLDDPLSAVDGRTERRLADALQRAEGGFLLVTHRLKEVPRFDRVIFLDAGRPMEDGAPTDLLSTQSSKFSAFSAFASLAGPRESRTSVSPRSRRSVSERKSRVSALGRRSSSGDLRAMIPFEPRAFEPGDLEFGPQVEVLVPTVVEGDAQEADVAVEGEREPEVYAFTNDEETGQDDSSSHGILVRYLGSLRLLTWLSLPSLACILLATSTPQAFLWLSGELGACGKACACEVKASLPWLGTLRFEASLPLLTVTFVLALVFRLLAWMLFEQSGQWASQGLHASMMQGLARTRTTFFDENPSGRILKRVMGDFDSLRLVGVMRVGDAVNAFAEAIFLTSVSALASPFAVVVAIPLGAFFYYVQSNVSPMLERAGRLNATWQGDVIHRETDLIDGASVFALYDALPQAFCRLGVSVRRFAGGRLLETVVSQWSRFWTGLSTSAYAACVLALVSFALQTGRLTEAMAAVVLSAVFRLAPCLDWLAWSTAYLGETKASARRVFEYVDLPQEQEAEFPQGAFARATTEHSAVDCAASPAALPGERLAGDIEFVGYSMSYRPDSPEILKDLSVCFQAGRRTGVVGRTGAGKSSLIQALYRMVHVRGGDIRIGGRSVFTSEPDTVRRRFGIVPQDPYLFEGTVRRNLDREGMVGQAALRQALEAVGLPLDLDTKVLEGGRNLSTGQRQLVCLARVLVADREIVLLDEPTSGVDVETDAHIQRVLKEALRGKTILAIAHRMQTLARYDWVVELSEGSVLREGRPEAFLERQEPSLQLRI
jgi:ABC-type multidrug transport system fused ATPase/permease subunit